MSGPDSADEKRDADGRNSRKTKILSVAARLVVHYGPHKTTVTDIAREAGVSVGAVYLEFPSKDDIVLALAEAKYERVLAAMEAALFPTSSRDARAPLADRIHRAFEARLAVFLDTCEEGTHGLDLIACTSSPVKTAERRFADHEQALIERALRGDERGTSPEAASTARALLRCYATFRPPYLCTNQPVTPAGRQMLLDALGEVHRLVSRGLLAATHDAGGTPSPPSSSSSSSSRSARGASSSRATTKR